MRFLKRDEQALLIGIVIGAVSLGAFLLKLNSK